MAGGDEQHSRRRPLVRRILGWLPEVLVISLVVGAFAAYHYDIGPRLGLAPKTPESTLIETLKIPAIRKPQPVAAGLSGGTDPSEAKLRAALAPLVSDPRLGRVSVVVRDLTTGRLVFRLGTGAMVPASTTKLFTSAAALETFGPDHRFETAVRRVPGTNKITLVGGGDPYLTSKPVKGDYPPKADLTTLARRTATALKQAGVTKIRLRYDDSLFSGQTRSPRWPASYEDVVPPITALWADEGKSPFGGYAEDPSKQAALDFKASLVASGIQVVNDPVRKVAAAGDERIAHVSSGTLAQIVSRLELVSDNAAAEVIAHQVGRAIVGDGSFVGGEKAIRQVLTRLRIPLKGLRLYDGSGLTRANRIDPASTTALIVLASSPEQPKLRAVLTGMPIAGFSGSLAWRFDNGPKYALGRLAAKTGTLTGAHGLAGFAADRSGRPIAFAVMTDQVAPANEYFAQQRIDKIAATLASCSCGTGP